MEGKVYISAKDEMKKRIKLAMAKKWQIIYTDNLQEADYILIEKQPDDRLLDAQFATLMAAREADIPVRYFKLGKEKTQIAAMKETRKNFDMEIE